MCDASVMKRWQAMVGGLAVVGFVACGGPPPKTPEKAASSAVARWQKRLGTVTECGQAVRPRGDESCSLQPIHECLHDALEACRPAHGTHLYSTSEGDPVRVDYFVAPEKGACLFVVVEDKSADPVGNKGVVEQECRTTSWRPQPDAPGCQALAPVDCRVVGTSPR